MGDSDVTILDAERMVQDFCEARDWDQFHNPKELAIGMVTESSELLELFRFKDSEQTRSLFSDPQKAEHIREELADVLFFTLRFAQMNDIDLSEALKDKIAKNDRKYPVEKSRGSNLKYDEL